MKKSILVFLLLSMAILPQSEVLINTYLDSIQRDPQIKMDAAGNSVVVWNSIGQNGANSSGDIYFQRLNATFGKVGNEVLVNDVTFGNQEKPALAMNNQGNFAITWASHSGFQSIYDIKVKLYKNNNPVGNEILVNTFSEGSQTNPEIAMNSEGKFTVVWDSWFQDGGDKGVYAQRFDENGNKVGSEFLVNTTTQYSQARPSVKYLGNGNIVVIWESWRQDIPNAAGYGMYGRIFSSEGIAVTGEFLINTYTNNYQWYGDIDVLQDGFAVVWCSWAQDGSDGGIYLQRFYNDGTKKGNEVLVNKTTNLYQWLPKVRSLGNDKLAVVWSSWRQDGDREGVYAVLLDEMNRAYSFETLVNNYTSSFQWEPDFLVIGQDELFVTWASWGQNNKDYDIIGKRVKPEKSQGLINPSVQIHSAGTTTSKIIVHVVDSTAVTGHTYEVKFDTAQTADSVYATITDITNSQIKINRYPLNKGVNTYYRTETFDGISVEFKPIFKLELDLNSSYFLNNSNSNLIFSYLVPLIGTRLLAPIDVALVWGSTDTLANGQYAAPLDTAIGMNGQKTVKTPFKAINILNNTKINLLIKEATATKNDKWEPKEEIVIMTPPPFQLVTTNTHAQINTALPTGNLTLPKPGDTNYVFTKRPIKSNDRFTFVANKSNIISDVSDNILVKDFTLYQNYPNPFNPATTIKFSIPQVSHVKLSVYNILGEKILTLKDEVLESGEYRVFADFSAFSSGVYFYILEFNKNVIAKKMMFLK